MGPPLNLGDVPEWLQALGGLAQVGQTVLAERRRMAAEWARDVEAFSGLSASALSEALTDDPRMLGALELAFDAAVRSAADEKRRLLAKVLSAALRDRSDDVLDATPMFLRAVDMLEPAHIRLLAILASPDIDGTHELAQSPLEGAMRRTEIFDRWTGAAQLLDPLLKALDREGLTFDAAVGTWGYVEAIALTPFGRSFLHFLEGEWLSRSHLDRAELVVRYQKRNPPVLFVRNVGPAAATDISVVTPTNPDHGDSLIERVDPFDLGPWTEREFQTEAPSLVFSPPYRIELAWHDGTGARRRVRYVEPQS